MVFKIFIKKTPNNQPPKFYGFSEKTKCIQTDSILENLQQTSQREFSKVFSLKISMVNRVMWLPNLIPFLFSKWLKKLN